MNEMSARVLFAIAPILGAVPIESLAQDDSLARNEAFLSWARSSLHPVSEQVDAPTAELSFFGDMIGHARIVSLGEGTHGAAEPLVFRNRLFRYLVEQQGFSAIAIESGTVESRVIDEYVLGGPGELEDIVAQGFSATMDDFPQNADLVRWMRSINQGRSAAEKVRFFGFDVPGSPTNGFSIRGIDTAVLEVIAFLSKVDETSARSFESRLEPYFPLSVSSYGQLSPEQRDRLTAIVSDLVSLIQRREWHHVEKSSRSEFDWAFVASLGARQIDTFFRFVPFGWTFDDGFAWAEEAGRYRDRAMMENMDWILSQLHGSDRILLFGALTHLSPVPVTHALNGGAQQISFGVYLNRRYAADIVTVGNIVSDGAIGNCRRGPQIELEPPPDTTLSHAFAGLGVRQFVLDLRSPPAAVESIFNQPTHLWNGRMSYSVPIPEAFGIAHFTGPVTTACSGAE